MVAKIGLDTAENERGKVCPPSVYRRLPRYNEAQANLKRVSNEQDDELSDAETQINGAVAAQQSATVELTSKTWWASYA